MSDEFNGFLTVRQLEAVRAAFELDAAQYGFNLARCDSPAPEPWSEYFDAATGHRWAGWLASTESRSPKALGAQLNRDNPYTAWLDADSGESRVTPRPAAHKRPPKLPDRS